IDAHAALVALEVVALIRGDLGVGATVDYSQGADVHAFPADAHAAEAQNATRAIEVDHGRPLLLVDVLLHFDEAAFARAVAEHHVLQFALAALVAHRAIEGMVGEQEFESTFARGGHHRAFGPHYHIFSHRQRAGCEELGRPFDLDDAHAASGLEREAVVVA